MTTVPDLGPLVVAARDGDREAFDQLVRATYASTYTLAFRLTGDPEDASDVVQDVYLRAYRGIRRYRGDSQVTTWLYRITANCAATHHGKRRRHSHDVMPDDGSVADADRSVDPHDRAEQGELRDHLDQAVAALPARLRAVVVLRDIYGLSHEAIADELGITESAAKVRLHRARRKLRDDLGGRHVEHAHAV